MAVVIIGIMVESVALPEFEGKETVTKWYGGWPSFHDAEIISVLLARSGESVIRVYPYYPEKPATVDFILERVIDLNLTDFSHQNVIFDLEIEMTDDQNGEKVFRLSLSPCYGVAGRIDARSMRVQLTPGTSPDGASNW